MVGWTFSGQSIRAGAFGCLKSKAGGRAIILGVFWGHDICSASHHPVTFLARKLYYHPVGGSQVRITSNTLNYLIFQNRK